MNMFNLVSHFWRAAEEESFTPSEAALYFYLLHKANTQKWQMPIRCPTTTICVFLSTTKQNVMKAREGLRRRGLIEYRSGSGTKDIPVYTLIDFSTPLSEQLTDELSPQLPVQLSGQLSLYKNKEKDKNDSIHNARENGVLSLEVLEKMFLEDERWQHSVLTLLLAKDIMDMTAENLKSQISQFFHYLNASGEKERETKDCKNHFVNWLMKQMKNIKHNGNLKSDNQDRHRATEICSSSTEAYRQPF